MIRAPRLARGGFSPSAAHVFGEAARSVFHLHNETGTENVFFRLRGGRPRGQFFRLTRTVRLIRTKIFSAAVASRPLTTALCAIFPRVLLWLRRRGRQRKRTCSPSAVYCNTRGKICQGQAAAEKFFVVKRGEDLIGRGGRITKIVYVIADVLLNRLYKQLIDRHAQSRR